MYIPRSSEERNREIDDALHDKRRLCLACNPDRERNCPNCGLSSKAIKEVMLNGIIRKDQRKSIVTNKKQPLTVVKEEVSMGPDDATNEPEKMPPVKIYDVEVLRGPDEVEGGWDNPEAMGFGTAVVYCYDSDQYKFYGPKDKLALIGELTGSLVVSFNGIKFDNRVLLGNDYQGNDRYWDDYDILLEVVRGKFGCQTVKEAELKLGDKEVHDNTIGLDGLAEGTFGLHKTGHGAKAPKLIAEGRWAEVFAYNLNDVRLTRKLYEKILQDGELCDRKGLIVKVEPTVIGQGQFLNTGGK